MAPLSRLGYIRLWPTADGQHQLAQFWFGCDGPGCDGPDDKSRALWIDVRHWYFAVHHEPPYENSCEFMHRVMPAWQKACAQQGVPFSVLRGALPKATAAALWVQSCQMAGLLVMAKIGVTSLTPQT